MRLRGSLAAIFLIACGSEAPGSASPDPTIGAAVKRGADGGSAAETTAGSDPYGSSGAVATSSSGGASSGGASGGEASSGATSSSGGSSSGGASSSASSTGGASSSGSSTSSSGGSSTGGLGTSTSSGGSTSGVPSSSGAVATSSSSSTGGTSASSSGSSGTSASSSGSSGTSTSSSSSSSSSSGSSGTPIACQETPIPGFTPSWHAPTSLHQGKCTAQQVEDFYNKCLDDNTTSIECAHYLSQTDTACGACILSRASDTKWGPVIDLGDNRFDLNWGGCLAAFENKLDGSGCGGKVSAREQCSYEACAKGCPGDWDPFGSWVDACIQKTVSPGGQCRTFEEAAWCTDDIIGTPAQACEWAANDTFITAYRRMVGLFCR